MEMAELYDKYLGSGWARNPERPEVWAGVENIPDEELWAVLENQRGKLVRFVRRRLQNDLERRTSIRPEFGLVNSILDPRILTIGFARRFATYKRGTLMIRDKERLKNILYHPERPVQIVISGKSHPRDDGGKKLIQELVNYIGHDGPRSRMVFIEDYDMNVARRLVQGVDVWLNNPRRPHEASGTSGMKVVPNGGLNCSILDGWWDEGFEPGLGWAIGDRTNVDDEGHQDWLDSRSLYHLLENEISPVFYHRVDNGIPRGWIQMVKKSIMKHAPEFSTNRMVRDYAVDSYVEAHNAYKCLGDNGMSRAKSALEWRNKIRSNWGQVSIVSVKDNAKSSNLIGQKVVLKAMVSLGALTPDDVRVQSVVGKIGPNRELVKTRVQDLKFVSTDSGVSIFESDIECDLVGHQGYSVRVVPFNEDVAIPSELSLITWES